MNVKIEIDCTPAEARAFLGLPDVEPLTDHLVSEMKTPLGAVGAEAGRTGGIHPPRLPVRQAGPGPGGGRCGSGGCGVRSSAASGPRPAGRSAGAALRSLAGRADRMPGPA